MDTKDRRSQADRQEMDTDEMSQEQLKSEADLTHGVLNNEKLQFDDTNYVYSSDTDTMYKVYELKDQLSHYLI